MAEPRPFRIQVSDEVLADLRARLARVRWPDEVPGGGWEYGADLGYMQALVEHWRERYDWRAHEARLNRLRQLTVDVGGIDLHFVHEPGRGPAPWRRYAMRARPSRSATWRTRCAASAATSRRPRARSASRASCSRRR